MIITQFLSTNHVPTDASLASLFLGYKYRRLFIFHQLKPWIRRDLWILQTTWRVLQPVLYQIILKLKTLWKQKRKICLTDFLSWLLNNLKLQKYLLTRRSRTHWSILSIWQDDSVITSWKWNAITLRNALRASIAIKCYWQCAQGHTLLFSTPRRTSSSIERFIHSRGIQINVAE